MTLLAAWHDLPDAERRARLRAMQALTRVLVGPAGRQLTEVFRPSETNPAALPSCDAALDGLAPVPRRRILASFAATLPASRQPVSPQETALTSPRYHGAANGRCKADE
jgi:hypothetical protein